MSTAQSPSNSKLLQKLRTLKRRLEWLIRIKAKGPIAARMYWKHDSDTLDDVRQLIAELRAQSLVWAALRTSRKETASAIVALCDAIERLPFPNVDEALFGHVIFTPAPRSKDQRRVETKGQEQEIARVESAIVASLDGVLPLLLELEDDTQATQAAVSEGGGTEPGANQRRKRRTPYQKRQPDANALTKLEQKGLWNREETAKLIGVSTRRLHDLIEEGVFVPTGGGKRKMISSDQIRAYLTKTGN